MATGQQVSSPAIPTTKERNKQMSKKDANKETKYIGFTAPVELAQWLEETANDEHRSVSGQINLILLKAKEANKAK